MSPAPPRISLCMIVRDEEAMLPDCLASVVDAVDEIVVIDTGSKDGTRKIAEQFGARVFDFAWCDDFAAARNEALKRARGGWVLILDADERLAPGAATSLRSAVADAEFDCGMLRLHDASRVDASPEDVVSGRARQAEIQLVPRLLRRADGLSYVDPIHENVMPWLRRRGNKVAGVDLDIVHLGATQQVVEAKGKLARNIALLRVRLTRDPGDLSAYGYLAHDYLRQGAMGDAFETAEEGWRRALSAPSIETSLHRLVTARVYLLIGRRRFAEAQETVHRALALEGDCPDFAFFEGYSAESAALETTDSKRRAELLVAAREGYRRCLGFGNRVFAQSFVTGARGCYGRTRLGTVELLLGNYSVARRIFEAASALSVQDRAARLGASEATLRIGDAGAALKLLQPLLDRSPDGWVLAASAALTLGRTDDARVFVECADARSAAGFVAAHRRQSLADLRAALAAEVA